MASPSFPEPPASMTPTSLEKCDSHVATLNANKDAWTKVSINERIQLLEECIENTLAVGHEWVEAGCRAKGIEQGSKLAGEVWFAGPTTTIRNMRLLVETLKAGGQPKPPQQWTRSNGQTVARVFPADLYDRILFTGFTADVWIEPGKPATQGNIYRQKSYGKETEGKVSLVLGAGNISSIGPMDMLYKLFVEDEVVILKTNPVNAYTGPMVERAFAPLINRGFFAVVHGGAEVGKHLCDHDGIHTIHITGSDQTHDAIVWGGNKKQIKERKKTGTPTNERPVTSELGCVTPVFVVPGAWSDAELDYQARQVAAMVSHNGSFNCNAAKVLVTAKNWPLRDEFIHRVKQTLACTPPRKAYYPGAESRYEAFMKKYPESLKLGEDGAEIVPWTLIPDVACKKGEYALTNEAFCGVIADLAIDATEADEFLDKAVAFANANIWGTLSCCMLIHPNTEKQYGAAFERAISDLQYGGIGINCWPGLIYGLCVTTWGAYPGHPLEDIESGRGVVHNTYLFDHPQKSVVKAPFRIRPTPVWFADHRTLSDVGRAMANFEASPSLLRLPGVVAPALRG